MNDSSLSNSILSNTWCSMEANRRSRRREVLHVRSGSSALAIMTGTAGWEPGAYFRTLTSAHIGGRSQASTRRNLNEPPPPATERSALY